MKEENGVEFHPTDVIQARRATRDDAEVLLEMLRIWQAGDQALTFEEFVDESVLREVPPIVIDFCEDYRDAIPAVEAAVQYFGYRGKVIEPRFNNISSFAEENGYDLSWIFGELVTEEDIREKINQLEQIFAIYQSVYHEAAKIGLRYYHAWREQDYELMKKLKQENPTDTDEKNMDDVYGFLGAIDWLRFWSDKGFTIAADY